MKRRHRAFALSRYVLPSMTYEQLHIDIIKAGNQLGAEILNTEFILNSSYIADNFIRQRTLFLLRPVVGHP